MILALSLRGGSVAALALGALLTLSGMASAQGLRGSFPQRSTGGGLRNVPSTNLNQNQNAQLMNLLQQQYLAQQALMQQQYLYGNQQNPFGMQQQQYPFGIQQQNPFGIQQQQYLYGTQQQNPFGMQQAFPFQQGLFGQQQFQGGPARVQVNPFDGR